MMRRKSVGLVGACGCEFLATKPQPHSACIRQPPIIESVWKVVAITLFASWASMAFQLPSADVRCAALGELTGFPPALQRAFTADAPEFDPISKPGPHDWLAVHPEPGQTFDEFTASCPNQPTDLRRIIYLQPLGEFAADRNPPIEKLREFASAFFAMEVKALPPVS